MGLLSWILVGGLAGWIGGKLMGGGNRGCLMNIIVGVIGAFLGGLIVNLLGGRGVTGFNLWSLFVATLGAVVFLGLLRLFTKK